MKYRNTVTGAIIDVKSEITGGNWQAVKSAVSVVKDDHTEIEAPVPTKRKGARKK